MKLAIRRSKLNLTIILSESDSKAKFEVFQRLNTGGSNASNQEIRNNIMINELKKYDISRLTLTFSEAIQISKNKAQSTMIINYDSTSEYFNVTWQKKDDKWKIGNVEEKN